MTMMSNIRRRARKVSDNFHTTVKNAQNRRKIRKIRLWRIK